MHVKQLAFPEWKLFNACPTFSCDNGLVHRRIAGTTVSGRLKEIRRCIRVHPRGSILRVMPVGIRAARKTPGSQFLTSWTILIQHAETAISKW